MSEQKNIERPLSPHIQIYRWTLTMLLSIAHRATGMALYAGTLFFALWLYAVAEGPDAYAGMQMLATHWFGRLILFAYIWALFHHMCGGLRHFIWDIGRGFKLIHVEILAWVTTLLPLLLALLTYYWAYKVGGVL